MYTKTFVMIAGIAAILAVAIAPSIFGTASAKITEKETCTNNGGQTKDGPCRGNTDSNKKIEECTATNPAGKLPGGHNPC